MNSGFPAERQRRDAWLSKHFDLAGPLPYGFVYGEQLSSKILPSWHSSREVSQENGYTRLRILHSDPKTGLVVRCECEVFNEFPALEWVVFLENQGNHDSLLLEDVQALNAFFFDESREFLLHRALGSNASRSDFAPVEERLTADSVLRLAPVGGRSSNTVSLPFFNLEEKSKGVVIAIGWSGQWEASWSVKEGIRIRVGMERTRIRLRPGEAIRTPRILLLFWEGDEPLRGNNLFRRFILAHRSPRKQGQPLLGPLSATGSPGVDIEFNAATELNQLASAERYRQFGYAPEYWWIDAGWYEGRWPNGVGNWFPRKDGFPNGLRPVSDGVRAMGYEGLLLWFEPERVYQGTWLDREHPEWVLRLPNHANGLLDLGNPDAREWLTDHISKMIEREGIGFFRQDFNMDPLPYWQAHDLPDRQGLHEIRHIEGLYAFWDTLLERHPGLLIDNCASGGRRLDLETTRRSIPLWRTDYHYFEPNGYQCHSYGLNHYLPLSGTGSGHPDLYAFRSSMNSALVLGWYLWERNFPIELGRRCLEEYFRLRHLYLGDFYPLTPYSTADDVWMAYQFHRDDLGEGMALAFRRPENREPFLSMSLRGLNPSTTYRVRIEDKELFLSGTALASGIEVRIEQAPGSALIHYVEARS